MKRIALVISGIGVAGILISCAADSAPQTSNCPPAVTLLNPAGWQLGEASYRARQQGDTITITATGESPTAGYRIQLAQQPMKIYPPKFALYRRPAEGIAAQVITPFSVCVAFKAATDFRVEFVSVRDSKGEHRVAVEPAARQSAGAN